MNSSEYTIIEPLVNLAYDKADHLLDLDEMKELKAALQKAAAALPYSISFDIMLRVFDSHRNHAITLMTTSLCGVGSDEPYRAHDESTVHRYVVDGEICEVPHDCCPHCWRTWAFKITPEFQTTGCSHCGYALGKQIKLLLDHDLCPHCEQGRLSIANPTCSSCGLVVDPDIIAWG